MDQIHRRFTAEQIRVLLLGYCQGTLCRSEVEEMLHLGKTRFFVLAEVEKRTGWRCSRVGQSAEELCNRVRNLACRPDTDFHRVCVSNGVDMNIDHSLRSGEPRLGPGVNALRRPPGAASFHPTARAPEQRPLPLR